MMRKFYSIFAGGFLAATTLCGAEFKLTDGGRAASCIVLRENATKTERHAAKELTQYLAKISKAPKALPPGGKEMKGKYNIYLVLAATGNEERAKKSGVDLKKLVPGDSFALSAK